MKNIVLFLALAAAPLSAQKTQIIQTCRPFGTLQEQAVLQQQWLETRMTTTLPALTRKYGVTMWVVPMREYNEDPVFSSIVSATTLNARRRSIYLFYE